MKNLNTNNINDVKSMLDAGFKYVTRRGYPRFNEEQGKVVSRHKTYSEAKKSCWENNAIDDLQYIYDEHMHKNA